MEAYASCSKRDIRSQFSSFPISTRKRLHSMKRWEEAAEVQKKAEKNFHTNVITKLFTRHAIRKKMFIQFHTFAAWRAALDWEGKVAERNRFLMLRRRSLSILLYRLLLAHSLLFIVNFSLSRRVPLVFIIGNFFIRFREWRLNVERKIFAVSVSDVCVVAWRWFLSNLPLISLPSAI